MFVYLRSNVHPSSFFFIFFVFFVLYGLFISNILILFIPIAFFNDLFFSFFFVLVKMEYIECRTDNGHVDNVTVGLSVAKYIFVWIKILDMFKLSRESIQIEDKLWLGCTNRPYKKLINISKREI